VYIFVPATRTKGFGAISADDTRRAAFGPEPVRGESGAVDCSTPHDVSAAHAAITMGIVR
jgi:hypothetical protein